MLEIKNLRCGYDSKFFLQDIDFKVEDGELIGIIGPNGSGKTTLLRAITRILKPKAGTILLENRNIWHMHFKELARKVAVVSQRSEGAVMSVEEFILLGRIPYYKRFQLIESKKDLDTAKRCMILTDTLKVKDQLMGQISGGERQLALIARALTQEPMLLLLDEPTTHLDITHQVRILDLVRKLNKELGLTVIMVLHDLNLASEYCHRLILLNGGRIQKEGKPEEVMDYRIIEDVYKTVVVVKKNPISSRPYIFTVSEEDKKRKEIRN
ncbi:MAG: ABC transporter ATP-binding protein [Candidatus Omnitrophica bacterium]|nr:ABC transporter ATP-binding protein [Candidatus Omnitrophota bacterium]